MPLPSTGYATADATNPGSVLTDFSLLIDLSRMPASWWSEVDTSDGTKGRAAKDSDETELATDWIDFDDTAETGWLRVKWSGTLAASGTQTIRIYPPVAANSSNAASATYGSDNAYDSNWVAYWPLYNANDRTSNANNLTEVSVSAGNATGKVGDGVHLDGSNDYLHVNDNSSLDISSEITLLGWAKSDLSSSSADEQTLIWKSRTTASNLCYGLRINTSDNAQFLIYDSGAQTDIGTTDVSDQAWHHLGGTYNGSTLQTYVDGSTDSSGTSHSGSIATGTEDLGVGAKDDPASPDDPFDGILNDLQIHSTARAGDWIAHEHDQSDDNATFWGTWSWQSAGDSVSLTRLAPFGIAASNTSEYVKSSTQTVSPGVIVSAEAFVDPQLNLAIFPAVTVSAESAAQPRLNLIIYPAVVVSAEAFTSPQLNLLTIPDAIASAESFGSHTVTAGSVSVLPTAVDSLEAFANPQLDLTIFPAVTVSTEAFTNPQLNLSVSAGVVTSAEAFVNPQVALVIFPGVAASAEAFGSTVVTSDTLFVLPEAISSLEAFVNPQLDLTVFPGVTTSGEAFVNPQVDLRLYPAITGSGEAFVNPQLNLSVLTAVTASEEAFAAPQVNLTVLPAVTDSAETFGSHAVTVGVATVSPEVIASAEVVANPTVTPGSVSVFPVVVVSEEAVAAPALSLTVISGVIDSLELFGDPTVNLLVQYVAPEAIISGEAFGDVLVAVETLGGLGLYVPQDGLYG